MENGDIPDENIQASVYTKGYQAYKARLIGNKVWHAKGSYTQPWIQANIGYQT